jgi:hypothetical protein
LCSQTIHGLTEGEGGINFRHFPLKTAIFYALTHALTDHSLVVPFQITLINVDRRH